ncbi:unnamed protein product [Tilletia laevis]|uniref:Uncharacterized protein n=3 Tax=Tilletia TaxID=13289 RepID=A0A8X7MX77_9BASI|nr:hypothetical protein CF336_g678 [Tilletia laevis]KAE8204288.1 hypothetical protein CF328_g1164 [Tilletia controversa]KAE8265256.1 hypothetical protein A4X03_0g380 [Tilletia caries]KAE8208587.1 hypothetical protein CF335_g310 [Tilletia laevis]KAE8253187.1 hypothetical protein A4X06_0g1636 [Tilletia controversa]
MKPATALLTIAAMAFVAQAAPLPLPNAIEMSKFQERAVAGLAGGIFEHLSLHHSRSSRSIGGNDYADTLRMKRAEDEVAVKTAEAAAKEGEAVVKAGEAAAVAAKQKVKSSKPWKWIFGSAVGGGIIDHMFFSGGNASPPAEPASNAAAAPTSTNPPPAYNPMYPPPAYNPAAAPTYMYPPPAYNPAAAPMYTYPPPPYNPPAHHKRDVRTFRYALDLLGEA